MKRPQTAWKAALALGCVPPALFFLFRKDFSAYSYTIRAMALVTLAATPVAMILGAIAGAVSDRITPLVSGRSEAKAPPVYAGLTGAIALLAFAPKPSLILPALAAGWVAGSVLYAFLSRGISKRALDGVTWVILAILVAYFIRAGQTPPPQGR